VHQDVKAAVHNDQQYLQHSVAAFDSPKPAGSVSGSPPIPTSQSSLFELSIAAVKANPVLAVAAVASVTALTVMLLRPARTPQSTFRAFEKRAVAQSKLAEKRISQAVRNSGVPGRLENLVGATTARLSSLDPAQLEPLRMQAMDMANRVLAKFGR
jgi:hypothetical protein